MFYTLASFYFQYILPKYYLLVSIHIGICTSRLSPIFDTVIIIEADSNEIFLCTTRRSITYQLFNIYTCTRYPLLVITYSVVYYYSALQVSGVIAIRFFVTNLGLDKLASFGEEIVRLLLVLLKVHSPQFHCQLLIYIRIVLANYVIDCIDRFMIYMIVSTYVHTVLM